MNKYIYLDHAATTPVDDDCLAAAMPYYKDVFYNPSSTHALGQKAAAAVELARQKCASAIGCLPSEIYFTSGGTEAVNWAMSAVRDTGKKRIVVSSIEHDCALAYASALGRDGFIVEHVKPDAYGMITPEALEEALTDDTGLVCIMTVNNIVGSVQPIKELAEISHRRGALFFTDAVQAVNSTDINVKISGVDMLALSAHKFYAPKGVGLLYVRTGVKISPMLYGGEQERGIRAGTHDVPSIVAMGTALEKAQGTREEYNAHVKKVATEFFKALDRGKPIKCANKTDDITSVVFDGINGGRLAVALSMSGVCCSVGSACSAGSATAPETLVEMGIENADCAVRFSFGKGTTTDDARKAALIVNSVVDRLKSGQ